MFKLAKLQVCDWEKVCFVHKVSHAALCLRKAHFVQEKYLCRQCVVRKTGKYTQHVFCEINIIHKNTKFRYLKFKKWTFSMFDLSWEGGRHPCPPLTTSLSQGEKPSLTYQCSLSSEKTRVTQFARSRRMMTCQFADKLFIAPEHDAYKFPD